MERMDGLLLVEGEDIEPKRFAATEGQFQYLEKTHPLKDEIEIRLLRHALRRELPILGICRGSQLLNVVCGGTLYGDVQKEKGSHRPHIDYHNYDTYRHPVTIVPGTPLARWYRRKTLRVNSYHHQGIRELAPRFQPMAHADDGLIEAYYDPEADFRGGTSISSRAHAEGIRREFRGSGRLSPRRYTAPIEVARKWRLKLSAASLFPSLRFRGSPQAPTLDTTAPSNNMLAWSTRPQSTRSSAAMEGRPRERSPFRPVLTALRQISNRQSAE